MDDVVERFETEAKRGVLQLAILFLSEEERYGYDVIKNLKEEGLVVEEGTLYPILRRLEEDKLLSSRWETTGSRPRKYYTITDYGKEVRGKMFASLKLFSAAIERLEKTSPRSGIDEWQTHRRIHRRSNKGYGTEEAR